MGSTREAGEDTAGSGRDWERAGRGAGGGLGEGLSLVGRTLSINRTDEESGESKFLDRHRREGIRRSDET